ncbi:DUF393 domain-containing protein [Neochlamydia sp. AcF95]|uniref:thiol-disulfide oxidoreductase DCC family protein n=1 Tax=Neochlamydia sp. AcF95 TaxID=2795734 RepID=UPI001BC9282D|nr:DUF393 domain-containing protein [Neochlamydia sp. AcF95]MBS4170940.1 Uncharacterized protein YuxK [Neochlamydia sp. AcF95]
MDKHLIFYDGTCALCSHVVYFLIKHDTKQLFLFAPLQGLTAEKLLGTLPRKVHTADSLILLKNYASSQKEVYLWGQAALQVLWLLGGRWKLIGWISFLPSFLYNWMYRLIAQNRQRFFLQNSCLLPKEQDKNRFLP